jgi:GTP-binding protein
MKISFPSAAFEASYGLSSQLTPSQCPEFVFCGRSNVGKSSLLNRLFQRKALARVSCVPGKTATVNFYRVGDVRFVDLPGYGYAKVAKGEKRRWNELISGYFAQDRDIALVFLLVDMRHAPSADDVAMAQSLIDAEMPFVVVLTKSDKLSRNARAERLAAFRGELPYGDELTLLPISSETGEGVDELRAIIEDAIDEEEDSAPEAE